MYLVAMGQLIKIIETKKSHQYILVIYMGPAWCGFHIVYAMLVSSVYPKVKCSLISSLINSLFLNKEYPDPLLDLYPAIK